MKLLLKHILRSIGKKPLQPIIIILTLALSMATAVFAFTIADTMQDEIEAAQAAKYGNADLMMSVGNTSESRFLFADDVIDVLGESANAVGCYELPLILGESENTTIAVATEFDKFSDVFDIEFLKYGKVTTGSVESVAFVSAKFAREHNLSIGDTLPVEAMGYAQIYRIEGIATFPFLATYDVMVDISSVVRAFASNSLLFAAIGEDFKPCNKVYIDIDHCENMDRAEAAALLKSDIRFAERGLEDLDSLEMRQVNLPVLELIINFAVALAAFLSSVVVFCCFYILANERTEENQALTYSGAKPKLLGALQYTEAMIYLIVGVPLGILAAIPVTKLISLFVSLQYVSVSIKPLAILKSVLILLGVCVLTTAFFIAINKRMRRTGTPYTIISPKWIIGLLLVIAGLFVLMYLLPANPRLVAYILTIAAIITLIFWSVPLLVKRVASAIENRLKNAQKPSTIAFRYALKNICSLKLLHNIVRLCALVVMVILTIGLVFVSVKGQIQAAEQIFDANYVVFNATNSCYQKTKTCKSAEAVYRAYLNQSSWGAVISTDDPSAYAQWLTIDRQPAGNEAIVSLGIAHSHDLKIGDSIKLELEGMEHEFVVSRITRVPANYIAINCANIGIPYNMLMVRGKDDVLPADLLGDLSQTTASELAPIAEVDSLLAHSINAVKTYMSAGKLLLFVFVLFSLIGIIDIFYESLRARREEFGLYRLAGMNHKNLRLMKVLELSITILFGVVIGLGAFVLSAFAINRGMTARGMEIFLNILLLLR